ncbi:MAG: hypothetical protein PHW18_00270 [Sulfuricurvum sp.]|uniref:hypothetical protein n=1 Tax=Sulfuricurvum sp. TaxID=2025608 RepID=UPI002619886C|nr:hypothetical protein [Sulfuricurvum sp.]MDD2827989.1 hypothetical protein [Sulfuricurvum sp.]MDD4948134.1 hypothetical protein [Sulfuricurvum sp.]
MSQNTTLEDLLKNYDPTPVEFDPAVDGGDEHLIREELLRKKEELKDVVTRLKEKQREARKVRR